MITGGEWRVVSRAATLFQDGPICSIRLGDFGGDISIDEKPPNVRRSDTVTGTAANHNMDS